MKRILFTNIKLYSSLFLAAVFAAGLCISGCKTTATKSLKSKEMKTKQGWLDNNTYLSYGYALADSNVILKNGKEPEEPEESCQRKATFNAKEKIIPAFMTNPNAKPGNVLRKKMAELLKIIEYGTVIKFEYNSDDKSCQCLLQIKKEDLRTMVEKVK